MPSVSSVTACIRTNGLAVTGWGQASPQFTEGEKRRRRGVTNPRTQCMEGTSSRSNWRGPSDTYIHQGSSPAQNLFPSPSG